MSAVAVSIIIDRPPPEVWDYVADIASHVEWMVDATEIRFTSNQQTGLGTTFECDTRIGPFKLVDSMAITSWETQLEMGVRHQGTVTGEGVFQLKPCGVSATEFSWEESLTFPWWMGARVGSMVAGPILAAVWRRNLRALKRFVENP